MSKAIDFSKGYDNYIMKNPSKKMNNRVLSEMIGCTPQSISNLNSKAPKSIAHLIKASDILGVKIEKFIVDK